MVYQNESLSYRELNDKASLLAAELIRKGAGPEQIVGIIAPPSLEMIVGLLAILKTGAAYLPIDPAYPAERISYMLKDSDSRLCLLVPGVELDRRVQYAGEFVNASVAATHEWSNETSLGFSHAGSDNLAYVIYTSGSTGRPKGVMVEHRSLVNLCTWHIHEFGVTEKDKAIKYAGFGFDASVWEIFPYLMAGAEIHVIPDTLRLDANQLQRHFKENGITIGFLPTQFCEQFMSWDNPTLRILLTGGDKLKSYRKQNYTLYNCYGPTENTVVTTVYPVTELSENIPIGYPIANSRIYIVDAYGHPQPIGIPGELCVAGAGLARGYLNQPELTREKFAASPLAGGERMYRTGDLARWTEQGTIEFLGRIDHQVKIRGFRIEIGEIEHRLMQIEGVSDTIVIDLEDASGSKYLCGYFVADREIPYDDVAAFLAERLPDYMVPAKLVQLNEMPLTSNGKIDRRALPLPSVHQGREENYVAPEGETEEAVAAFWQEVLGTERVGACESFFMTGGDSLKAAVLQVKLERRFGVRIPVPVLFERPTVREQAEWILQGKKNNSEDENEAVPVQATLPPIQKAKRDGVYPLSSAQRRLYFIEQMEQVGTAYNAPFTMRIEGNVNTERLERAFREMIARHDAFRTSFHWDKDKVVQRVRSADAVSFQLHKRAVSESRINEEIGSLIQPFDLTKAPLMRAYLVECESDGRTVLLVDFHHIVVDGVSANIFFEELSKLYHGEALPELPVGFADFAVWQNETGSRMRFGEPEQYWKQTLAGELPVLQLPISKVRPPKQSYDGDTVTLELDALLTGRLKRFAANTGTTTYMVLFAAYHALLFRYTNQEDMITGVPLAGRMREEIQASIGMFVNTMPVRCYPEKSKTFASFLQEVKTVLFNTFEYQDYDLEELVRSLNIPRDPSRNLLFDTLFVMQNTGKLELKLEGSKVDLFPYIHPISKYDLMVDITEEESAVRIHLQYCTELFDRADIEVFGERFVRLLSDATGNPDKSISELSMMSESDFDHVVNRLNQTESSYRMDMTIHGLFEEQVERTPDKDALVFGERSMTYRELNERANRLAHTLRSKGVTSDQVVGLMAGRSFEMIIGLLAILKAGGAYVPIDPEYPEERIVYMLENSNTKLLLTQGEQSGKVAFSGETLLIDRDEAYSERSSNLPNANKPEDLLYVIYTSGTTGKPKGVMIEHRNIVNLLHHVYNHTNVDYGGNVLQFTTISFDVCSQEIWSTLASGGTLHLITNELRMSVGDLLSFIEERNIEILFMPVSFLKFILNEKEYADRFPSSVKHVITAGEQLIVPEKFRTHLQRYGVFLHNHYGPSETHVVTAHTIDPNGIIPELPPIGKPIANTQIYILNDSLHPQPAGVAGELHIAGHNVGRGYYNNEEMTRERYLPNPFAPGERMYKTGDLARWTPEGTIEFLGRLDHQVKIRGFRIELGEVENCLLNHPNVTETIVIAKDDDKGGKYLCSYFVAERELTVSELREHIGRELPDYMIPSYFVQLANMPLTPNGKIDRKALPEPDRVESRSVSFVAPSTDNELAVAEVWQEVLQLDRVGVHDNFFEVGGHSLKATIVVARLQKQFEIRMNDIFAYQTLGDLAAHIRPRSNHLKTLLEKVKQSRQLSEHIDFSAEKDEYMKRLGDYEETDFKAINGYGEVLLTGATGYLGAHLLSEAMTLKDWNVHAIVRAGSDGSAYERLRGKCEFYFGSDWFERHKNRIFVYAGDLTQENLGLSDACYQELADKTDAVFHAAANVKHYGSYEDFELQNVTATAYLLDFAASGKKKDMHHMSTLGVATGVVEGKGQVCFTEYDLDVGQQFENYYAKTKFEAERLVMDARVKGIATNIYRLGNIVFHSETGRFQENIADNAFYTTIKSFLELGTAPIDDQAIDFSFVDYISRAAILLADCRALRNEVFHLANPHDTVVGKVLQDNSLDLPVRLVPFEEFVDYLYLHYEDDFLKEAIQNIMLHYGWMEETALSTMFDIHSSKTDFVLSKLGFEWPKLDRVKIERMFEFCKEVGYL
ncbi:non-ribosomal peptide synthetase module [Paenibacillus sp. DMB20]|nr:non-ribosomal peptide synthetase module [Paenibacillus sp. DMB20]